MERLRQDPAANARRIGQIEFSFQSQGVPSEKAGREQFESRLRFSSEPFGPFALANTFAGFLFVALILAADLCLQSRRPLTLGTAIIWGIVLLLLLYCLVLTKSRTAWIGLVVALAFWGTCLLVRGRFRLNRRTLMVGAAVLVVLIALFAVAALGRGFDVQVLSEAPKSLDYRLQYWKGAMGVVREHPVFGVGPGNFRQHYLRYKLPQSSEEIADPHNLILDLWTSGGLLALIGFAGCLIGAIVPFVRRRTDEAANDQSPETRALSPGRRRSPRQRPLFCWRFSRPSSRPPTTSTHGSSCCLAAGWSLTAFCVVKSTRGRSPLRLLEERHSD